MERVHGHWGLDGNIEAMDQELEEIRWRKPDRVTYGLWEDDPDSMTEFQVATKATRFVVLEYRKEVRPTRLRRRVTEFWDFPERRVLRSTPSILTAEDMGRIAKGTITVSDFDYITIPKKTAGRWHWETKDIDTL